MSRLTSYTNLFGYSINYQLDKVGNILSSTDSKNKTISYSYGSDNRLLSLTDTSGKVTKFNYNESGLPFEIVYGNGIKSLQSYDKLGRIKEIASNGNPNSGIFTYEYDKNGNITTIQGYDGTQTFSYDELNRLTGWTNEAGTLTTYQYDAVGNLTKKGSQTFTYNAANQITNTGFTYDVNGNLTKDSKYNYIYNHENQLTKVTKVSDGSTVATYTYDYRGLRISKTTPSGGTIYYHWDDQDRLVRESDTNGNTLSLYIYNGIELVAVEKGGFMYYTHTNHRGDILALTDANGNRVATYNYGPWGELISKTGTVDIPFRYAGYYYDQETGLYYLKARYYNSELGRFLTKDGIENGDNQVPITLNLYAYANNNPIMMVDPDGKFAWLWWMAKGALISGFVAYVKYKVEVKLGIQKANKSNMLVQVGTAAAIGAVTGGIGASALGRVGGLLKLAKNKGYLSSKEIKIANYFIYEQYNILKSIVNKFNTNPGGLSWKEVIAREAKKFF
ncbi:RHS repeat-associated core domain-containing protein [Bacillus sp. AL-1R]